MAFARDYLKYEHFMSEALMIEQNIRTRSFSQGILTLSLFKQSLLIKNNNIACSVGETGNSEIRFLSTGGGCGQLLSLGANEGCHYFCWADAAKDETNVI